VTGRHWRDLAACRDLATADDDPFFDGTEDSDRHALGICATCPVQAACLAYAVRTGQPYGVWGGKSQQDLRRLIVQARQGHTWAGQPTERHHNAAKARCKRGHRFTTANTYYAPDGQRRCRTCLRDAHLSWATRADQPTEDTSTRPARGGGQRG
jgi:WhiB family redox-sensing transcriptional regulator